MSHQNQIVVTRVYIERVMFLGEPPREKIEYVKKLGYTRREGQWTRYNSAQETISQSELEQKIKA